LISPRRFLSLAQTAFASRPVNKKIVVFESDDWGSIRTPRGASEAFRKLNIDLKKDPYHRYDILESPIDLEHTTELLKSLERATSRKVKITLNYVMCNPDFERIRASDYQIYYPEDFTTTYYKYWGQNNAINVVKESMKEGYFTPQFHGREHVHVPVWLELLRTGDKVIRKAFDLGFWGISHALYNIPSRKLQATFDARHQDDLKFMADALEDGLNKFENCFGFRSVSMIPNNYIWPEKLDSSLLNAGTKYMQGMKMHAHNWSERTEKRRYSIRASGKANRAGLIQLVRNTAFEPSFYKDKNKVLKTCLNEIGTAFLLKQPAVVSMHRINFVGGLSEKNRLENLALFKQLVESITKRWPDVEFWDSIQLGDHFAAQPD